MPTITAIHASGRWSLVEKHLATDVQGWRRLGASIITHTEIGGLSPDEIEAIMGGPEWDNWRGPDVPGQDECAVQWAVDEWEFVSGRVHKLTDTQHFRDVDPGEKPQLFPKFYTAIVVLRHKATGRLVTVFAVHFPTRSTEKRRQIWSECIDELERLVADVEGHVIVAADWNAGWAKAADRKLMVEGLATAGVEFAWDGRIPKVRDDSLIDGIATDLTILTCTLLPQGKSAEEFHQPVIVELKIPDTTIPTPTPQEPTMTTFTRSQWGAVAARSGPGAMQPAEVDGVAIHWPGTDVKIRGVANVKAALRSYQRDHMDNPEKRWSDIAYQEAIDQDGNVYQLRGFGTRSGANGNTDVNERFGAILLMLATGEQPTEKMLTAARGRIAAFRKRYPRGTRVVPHSAVRPGSTDCPGDIVRKLIAQGALAALAPVAEPVKVDLGKRALERAADQSRNGPTFGKDECLMRVRGLYGAPAIGDFDGDGAADAEDGWKATKKRHTGTAVTNIPAGVPLWWGGGTADHGHVAVSAGGGQCWSTDIKRTGRFDKVAITEINRKWGLPFLGWTEDINGVTVYTPPSTEKEPDMPKPTGMQLLQSELLAVLAEREPDILAARAKQPGKGAAAKVAFASLRTAIKALR